MQTEYRHIAYCIQSHAVVQVVAHVRNMEEMGEILFAPMDGLHDELTFTGRKTGVDVVYSVIIEIVNDRIQFSQIRDVLVHFFIRFVVEITHYPVACALVVLFCIKFTDAA